MNTENLEKVHSVFYGNEEESSTLLKIVKSFDDVSLITEGRRVSLSSSSRQSTAVIREHPQQRVAYLFFHRHNKSVNILDRLLLGKCQKLFVELEKLIANNRVHVLVLYSVKRGFIVGSDVNMIYQFDQSQDAVRMCMETHEFLFKLENLSIPTVAAIHGACMGGGLEVALSCSHRVSSDDKSTLLGFPEIKLGLLPGAGGTVRLPRIIGLSEALQMILTGANIDAKKAKNLGILDRVFSFGERECDFFSKVRSFAMELASTSAAANISSSKLLVDKYSRRPRSMKKMLLEMNPIGRSILEYKTNNYLNTLTKGRYHAPYIALETVMRTYSASSLREAAEIEATNFGKLACTKQAKSLINLFQMIETTKRIENFCNPAKIFQVNRIGIIGSGVMGSGIAQLAAYKNYQIYMKDIDPYTVQSGMKRITTLFRNLVVREKISEEDRVQYMTNITAGTTYNQLSDVQIVVEAAIEREDIKQDILKTIEELNPSVIYATNTSSIPITSIATVAKKKENVLGIHFFNPVHKIPLVEIVKTKYTSESAIATIYQFTLNLGKIPIIVNDGPGFLTTRMSSVYSLEAIHLVLEGCPFEQIDSALYEFGLPMGPLMNMDTSGLDISLSVFPVLSKKLGLDFDQYSALHDLVKGELALGRKVGKGFYMYDDRGRRMGVNPAAIRIFAKYQDSLNNNNKNNNNNNTIIHTLGTGGGSGTQYLREFKKDIVDRCILILINEATKCMEEGIVTAPEDVDLSMVLGLGFPPFRGGGLLGYCDQRGVTNVVKRLQQLAQKYGNRFRPSPLLRKMAKNNQRFFPERQDLNILKSKM